MNLRTSTESYDIEFDITGPSNLTEIVPMIGMDITVPRDRLS